jgi:hypothetical protein
MEVFAVPEPAPTGLCRTCAHERGDKCAQQDLGHGGLWRYGGEREARTVTVHGVTELRRAIRCERYKAKGGADDGA